MIHKGSAGSSPAAVTGNRMAEKNSFRIFTLSIFLNDAVGQGYFVIQTVGISACGW